MTHIRPLQFGEFADVVYNGQRGELGLDQTIASIVEALEAFHMGDECSPVGGPPRRRVVGDELVLGGYLYVVAGLRFH